MKAKKVYEFRTSGEIVSMGKDYYRNKFIDLLKEKYTENFKITYNNSTNTIYIEKKSLFTFIKIDNFDLITFDFNIEAPECDIAFIKLNKLIKFDDNIKINCNKLTIRGCEKLNNLPTINAKGIILIGLDNITDLTPLNWEKLNYIEIMGLEKITEIPVNKLTDLRFFKVSYCNNLLTVPNEIIINRLYKNWVDNDDTQFILFDNNLLQNLPTILLVPNGSIDIRANTNLIYKKIFKIKKWEIGNEIKSQYGFTLKGDIIVGGKYYKIYKKNSFYES